MPNVKQRIERVRRKGPETPPRETLAWARDQVAVATCGYKPGGHRLDLRRLDSDEKSELVRLVQDATGDGGFITMEAFGKSRGRFEALVEKGCGKPSGSIFQVVREFAELRALNAANQRELLAPPRRAKLEEAGSVTVRKNWCWDMVKNGALWPSHLGALVFLMSTWENGGLPVNDMNAVSFEGDQIVWDIRRGHLLYDGNLSEEQRIVDHLAANSFIEIEKRGRVWAITQGSRLRRFRAAKPKAA